MDFASLMKGFVTLLVAVQHVSRSLHRRFALRAVAIIGGFDVLGVLVIAPLPLQSPLAPSGS